MSFYYLRLQALQACLSAENVTLQKRKIYQDSNLYARACLNVKWP